MRVRRGNRRAQKRKKVLKQAKGYYGAKSKAYRVAREAVDKSHSYAYRDRRNRKRDFRRLWIVRINAAARLNGLSYNRLINGLKVAGCEVNRKMLAEVAVDDPSGFTALVEAAKLALGQKDAPEEGAAKAAAAEAVASEDAAAKAAAAAVVAQALEMEPEAEPAVAGASEEE